MIEMIEIIYNKNDLRLYISLVKTFEISSTKPKTQSQRLKLVSLIGMSHKEGDRRNYNMYLFQIKQKF